MEIRKLTGRERFEAYKISLFCFHGREDDIESKREQTEQETLEDWGAFAEDGTLMARIINNKYQFMLDGTPVQAGGIGAVSTLPQYRDQGAVRAIFKELLAEAYENGEVISALYPFKHAFYRKQGYEVITYQNNYELVPALLQHYRFDGTVKMWKQGDSVLPYLEIYNKFSGSYNLSMPRDEKSMLEHMKVEKLYRDRKFTYLFTKDGRDIAYLTFTDIRNDPKAILHVEESAWINRDGFYAILSFLGRFEADYGMIQLPLPSGIDLIHLLQTPRAYEVHKSTRFDFMVRVIHVPKLLEAIRKPADCDFTIEVKDDLLKKNNGIWRVTEDTVTLLTENCTADIVLDQRSLAQLAVGTMNLSEAMLKTDVTVNQKEDMLSTVFHEKKIFVGEHF